MKKLDKVYIQCNCRSKFGPFYRIGPVDYRIRKYKEKIKDLNDQIDKYSKLVDKLYN